MGQGEREEEEDAKAAEKVDDEEESIHCKTGALAPMLERQGGGRGEGGREGGETESINRNLLIEHQEQVTNII